MNSKAFVFLGLLFAVLLLVTSAVAEETTSKEVNKEDEAKETNQWGRMRCPFGCCGYELYGGCRWCCKSANEASQFTQAQAQIQTENEEVADATYGDYYGGGGWGGGRGWGGGGHGWGGGGWGGGGRGWGGGGRGWGGGGRGWGGGGWGGGGCGWGGGRGGGWGGGVNGGGWGGGACRFGCCGGYGGYGGGCRYCCASAAEALSYMQNEAKP